MMVLTIECPILNRCARVSKSSPVAKYLRVRASLFAVIAPSPTRITIFASREPAAALVEEVHHQWKSLETTLTTYRLSSQLRYNRMRREFNKSGADRTPLFEWEFYEDLEPSFRTYRQIEPDHVDPLQLPETTSDVQPSGDTNEDPRLSQSTPIQKSLHFLNQRKRRPLTQEERDDNP
ncbi:hypothetical protein ACHWQZ_G010805 [Mnemiopsis leidyi]